jgi:hypothetical protein
MKKRLTAVLSVYMSKALYDDHLLANQRDHKTMISGLGGMGWILTRINVSDAAIAMPSAQWA